MKTEWTKLNDKDTKELRKELGLPVTKGLVYWYRAEARSWKKKTVVDYEVVETYEPGGSKEILITLEDGRQVRIHGDYLADMQRPSFLSDIGENTEAPKRITGKLGKRIESSTDCYIVVDLETTGTNHEKDEITEIGAIQYVKGKEAARFQVFVKTEVEIPRRVEKLTGISNDMLTMFGKEPKEAYESFRNFVGDGILIGHNFTAFDSKFLEDAYVRELNCHFPNDYVDTLFLARKMLPDLRHHSLESLSEELQIDYSKAHRAIEDCEINHLVYEKLISDCLSGDEASEPYLEKEEIRNPALDGEQEETKEEELIEVVNREAWQVKLSSSFHELEEEFGLFPHSFSIMANAGKEGKISSYAICVYEPELVEDRKDSSRNTVLVRVKENVLKSNGKMVEVFSKSFEKPEEKKRLEKDSEEFIECLLMCIRKGIQDYLPKAAGFACCSRYQECSDNKKCIHPNVLYAKACQYRKNLEEGHIFYEKGDLLCQ